MDGGSPGSQIQILEGEEGGSGSYLFCFPWQEASEGGNGEVPGSCPVSHDPPEVQVVH